MVENVGIAFVALLLLFLLLLLLLLFFLSSVMCGVLIVIGWPKIRRSTTKEDTEIQKYTHISIGKRPQINHVLVHKGKENIWNPKILSIQIGEQNTDIDDIFYCFYMTKKKKKKKNSMFFFFCLVFFVLFFVFCLFLFCFFTILSHYRILVQ